MVLSNERRMHWASRMIELVTGQPYGDGDVVMNMGVGTPYDDQQVWVTGNWNGDTGKRLGDALERIDVEILWYDEYSECSECYKLLRSEPDSYHWQPDYLWTENGPVCTTCIIEFYVVENFESHYAANDYVNNSDTALNFPNADRWLEGQGFESEEDYDETDREYSNGWFEHMNDEPKDVLERLLAEDESAEVVFVVSEVSQFYLRFKAYVRRTEDDN